MSNFLNCTTGFTFAFDPEVGASRKVSEKNVTVQFDLSGSVKPTCATVEILLRELFKNNSEVVSGIKEGDK